MRRTLLTGLAAWQIVMLGALAVSPLSTATSCGLALGHVALAALALAARGGHIPAGVVLVASYALGVLDWRAIGDLGSSLAFAACWLVNLTALVSAFALSRKLSILLVALAAALVPLAIVLVNPQWGLEFPSAVLVTQLAILGATQLGSWALSRFTAAADEAVSSSRDAFRDAVATRTRRREVAEDARILHDSAINTLGAVANGGAGTSDVAAVRARCARDVVVVRELLVASTDRTTTATAFEEMFDSAPVRLSRSGLDPRQLAHLSDAATPEQVRAVVGAARELLLNTLKHSGVREAGVRTEFENGELVVEVSDRGRGFDGAIRPGRGLARSVLSRLTHAGATATISSKEGIGTTGVIRLPLDLSTSRELAPEHPPLDVVAGGEALGRRSAFFWAIGVTVVGVVLETVNRAGLASPAYPMLAVNVIAIIVAWRAFRVSVRVRAALAACLIALSVLAFVLSGAAVSFGSVDAVLWQALAPSAALVLVLAVPVANPRRAAWLSLLIYGMGSFVLAGLVTPMLGGNALTVFIAGLVGVGFSLAWMHFRGAIARIGSKVDADQESVFRARIQESRIEAADAVRMHWMQAGLDGSIGVLDALSTGEADPNSPEVRSACALEESFLRQISLLSSEAVHLGPWLVRVLGECRQRGSALRLSADDVDIENADVADRLGELLLSCARATPAAGQLSITVFEQAGAATCTVVGDFPWVAGAGRHWVADQPNAMTADLTINTYGSQDVLQLVVEARRLSTSAVDQWDRSTTEMSLT
ncbi:sensor histidine kinase [Pseudoclavibacter terrae]|uniref:sensor histidine kinase n=1 Tax=Pseudoclavibacter terrae TaxID=1530195 RepID=UPI00232D8BF8|nr:ATP-binding protein [Pseudoclavibacter terrae]